MKRLITLVFVLLILPISCFALTPKTDAVYVQAAELSDEELAELIDALQALHSSLANDSGSPVLHPGDILFDDGDLTVVFDGFTVDSPALYINLIITNTTDAVLRLKSYHFTVNGWDAITYHSLGDSTVTINANSKSKQSLRFDNGADLAEISSVDEIVYFDCNFTISTAHYMELFDFYDSPRRFNMK